MPELATPCACPSCARRAAMTPEQRAAFDAEDRSEEALELEFVDGLLTPTAHRPRRDPRAKQTRLEQQIATARRRLAKHGICVEAT